METLPSEVLLYIFNKLEVLDRLSCSLVCRRWFNLLSGELRSLTSLELVFVGYKCDAELCFGPSMHFGAVCLSMSLCACWSHRLRRRQLLDMVLGISGQYLRSIFIDDHILSKTEYALDPVIFRMLFDTCPHLDTLHMDNLTVPVNCQLTLFRIGELKRLQILRLVDCHPMHVFNDRLLFLVIKNNTLRELTVRGTSFISDSTLVALGNYCPLLRRLDFTGCSSLTAAGIVQLFRRLVTKQHDIVYVNVTGVGLDVHSLRYWMCHSTQDNDDAAHSAETDLNEHFIAMSETPMGTGHSACYMRRCTSPKKTLLLYSN
ncbi:hypothetical protein T05_9192 [Trichinella murrelli]|uniref:F-box domain-containing protein n=1 Tax=Trichinella murrelli TaxID=144512 RepID=A0A0V0U1E3_9BILA|nr:hypothetical protein T05_9192 [Trichinella murrelli]